MIAEALGVSEERLSRALAQAYYGDPTRKLKFLDVAAWAMKAYERFLYLQQRVEAMEGVSRGEWLTIKDVQNMLGISRATIYRHLKVNLFVRKKIGGRTYVHAPEAASYLRMVGSLRPQANKVFLQREPDEPRNARPDSSKNGPDTRCGSDGTQPDVHPEPRVVLKDRSRRPQLEPVDGPRR